MLYHVDNTLLMNHHRQTGETAMKVSKVRETTSAAGATRSFQGGPPYHSDISDEYLVALQKQVDACKPEGFQLSPISEAGW